MRSIGVPSAAFTIDLRQKTTCTKNRISAVLSSRFYLSRCQPKNIPLGAHPKSAASSSHPASCRGAYRDRHGRGGGERWPRVVASIVLWACRRTIALRTAKPCGPDAPMLAPSLRRRSRVSQVTGARKPGPRGDHGATVPTTAQGRPGIWLTCGSAACFFSARGPWASAGARSSLRPLA